MNYLVRILAICFILAVGACSNQNEVVEPTVMPTEIPTIQAATPLPTAVQPDSTTSGGWAVTFRYQFPDEYWHIGKHSYGFLIDCPDLTFDYNGEWLIFNVTNEVDPLPFPVFLRLNGLSVEPFSPAYMQQSVIHPDQATEAVVHLVGLSEQQAEDAQNECELLIAWDLSAPKVMEPEGVFKP